MIADVEDFIRTNTRPLRPPLLPELTLLLADDAVALWRLTEEELGEIGLPAPFWAFAWAGGQALARYVLDHPETVAGKRVLDVASGSGLVAIAAMRAGATQAAAADIDPFAAHAVRLNAALNGVGVTALTADPVGAPTSAEVVLIGDLFYERDLAERLIAWVEALAAEGRSVLIGDPGRAYLPKARLAPLAEYETPVSRALEDAEVKRTRVWAPANRPVDERRDVR